MRETGAVFTTEENMTELAALSKRFHALLHVARTTRARPLEGFRRRGGG